MLVLLFSAISFAQPEVSILIVPEEPNITTFSAGYQKIYVGAIGWEGYTQVTLNTSDFEVIGGNNTIPLNEQFVRFDINGSTAGLKEYSLTFTGSNPDFTINESFFVEAEPLTEGGPYVLSDFDFTQIYTSNQDIKFDCFGSTIYSTGCKSNGYYRIGNEDWTQFSFSSPIQFSFDAEETIEIQTENNLGISTLTQFNLTIDKSNPRMLNLNPIVNGTSVTLTYFADDASSGIKNYWISKDNTSWIYTENTTYQFTGLSGTNIFYVKATDNSDKNSEVMEVNATIVNQTTSSGGSSGAYVTINNQNEDLQETDTNDNLEPTEQDLNEESEEQPIDEENTDFKEDTSTNNNTVNTSNADDSAKTSMSVTQTGSTMSFPDMTGFFVLNIPEINFSVPEVDTTGLISVWMPDTGMLWVPVILLVAIISMVMVIRNKKNRGGKK